MLVFENVILLYSKLNIYRPSRDGHLNIYIFSYFYFNIQIEYCKPEYHNTEEPDDRRDDFETSRHVTQSPPNVRERRRTKM